MAREPRNSKSPPAANVSFFKKASPIEYLWINGVFPGRAIGLAFDNAYTVFVSDNGSGKTTALHILNCLLSGKYNELLRYKSLNAKIKFNGEKEISINLKGILSSGMTRVVERMFGGRLNPLEAASLMDGILNKSYEEVRSDKKIMDIMVRAHLPPRMVYERIYDVASTSLGDERTPASVQRQNVELTRLRECVNSHLNGVVLYLPTYRRVEQDLQSLLKLDKIDDKIISINFGMKDVRSRINEITRSIRDFFALSYSKVSGQLLEEMTREADVSEAMKKDISNLKEVETVLNRIGTNISQSSKSNIIQMINDGSVFKRPYLVLFLHRMLSNYEEIRHLDDSIKSFVSICNKYLIDKQLVFDNAETQISIKSTFSDEPLDLDGLSSGEKQLIGVFSQLYLTNQKNFSIIFDEPELSLSVDWQKRILPDIIESQRCNFLAAATHSPFIFENELQKYARSVDFKREIKPAS